SPRLLHISFREPIRSPNGCPNATGPASGDRSLASPDGPGAPGPTGSAHRQRGPPIGVNGTPPGEGSSRPRQRRGGADLAGAAPLGTNLVAPGLLRACESLSLALGLDIPGVKSPAVRPRPLCCLPLGIGLSSPSPASARPIPGCASFPAH